MLSPLDFDQRLGGVRARARAFFRPVGPGRARAFFSPAVAERVRACLALVVVERARTFSAFAVASLILLQPSLAYAGGPTPPQAALDLRPVAVPVTLGPGNVIDAFQFDSAFAKQSTSGDAEPDLGDVLIGTRSLRVTTDGDGAQVNVRARNLGPLDLSGSFLKLDLKLYGVQHLDYLYVYLSTDGFETYDAFPVLTGGRDKADSYALNDDWFTITSNLGLTAGGATPSIDLTRVTDIQLSLKDLGDGPVTAWFDALAAVPRPPRGKVSLVFDDARDGAFLFALPLARALGLKASIAAIVDLIGQPTFMTLEELRIAERFGGWEVIAHHKSPLESGGFDTLSDEELVSELVGVKSWLLEHGFRRGADVIAYPYGSFDEASLARVQEYFAAGRTIIRSQGLETWPPADPYRLRALSVSILDTPAIINAAIDRAAREHSWLVLVFHEIVPQVSDIDTWYFSQDLASVFAHLAAADVDVVLLSDAVFGR